MNGIRWARLAGAAALLLTALRPVLAAPAYDYQFLDLGSERLTPFDMNASGVMVGQSSGGYCFLWDASGIHRTAECLTRINNNGVAIGTLNNIFIIRQPDGTLSYLPPVPGAIRAGAEDINDMGQIVGIALDSSLNRHGVLYNGNSVTTFDIPGAQSTEPSGINNAGQIVGAWYLPPEGHSFLLSGGAVTEIAYPGARSTGVVDINNAGQVVGMYFMDNAQHAFLYENGVYTTIDVPNQPPHWLTVVRAINDRGQIMGSYIDPNPGGGVNVGFIATPVAAVPEPGTLALLLGPGLLALWRAPRRSKRQARLSTAGRLGVIMGV